jgi:hypothetical protein
MQSEMVSQKKEDRFIFVEGGNVTMENPTYAGGIGMVIDRRVDTVIHLTGKIVKTLVTVATRWAKNRDLQSFFLFLIHRHPFRSVHTPPQPIVARCRFSFLDRVKEGLSTIFPLMIFSKYD